MLQQEGSLVFQRVVAQHLVRDTGLPVAGKEGARIAHIVPFRKAGAVDGLVFGDDVKLGQIEGNGFHVPA